ncbi:hypothetical protein DFJ58DRAFT_838757 [Suillus subalutaceus]|uniref:uncharacterized protein n=1 Tax=Suillus subalutaceus TaxID=48586 RepID=UPI001B88643A|nr:uncharacterized protein DFJ58DRAFT_838757 [Suillus subalutaceus]KAG1865021.1 hypothetical protein DFJ58DRAFT_838757 [Suillus subalutaceus]
MWTLDSGLKGGRTKASLVEANSLCSPVGTVYPQLCACVSLKDTEWLAKLWCYSAATWLLPPGSPTPVGISEEYPATYAEDLKKIDVAVGNCVTFLKKSFKEQLKKFNRTIAGVTPLDENGAINLHKQVLSMV